MTARAKIFADFFHNFVDMKQSIGFLPENKRQDLQQLVDLIRIHIKDVGMVILFGSYAKNKRSEERRVGKECRSRWSPYH